VSTTVQGLFQGTVSGYTSGGYTGGLPPGPAIASNIIDKFPFATNTTSASDVGDLSQGRYYSGSQSSTVSGYKTGGITSTTTQNTIDKFPFAANANATDVGDISVRRYGVAGQSSRVNGYTTGGYAQPLLIYDVIDKFPFAANANATDVGDLTQARNLVSGQSSSTSGYTSGGYTYPPVPGLRRNTIDKFPFAFNANATDVGDMTITKYGHAGISSTTHGYAAGGDNYIGTEKFPFATDANAANVLNLSLTRFASAGISSTSFGYISSGYNPGVPFPFASNTIDRFPFATDVTATDVGDATERRIAPAGNQY
jgi:hypothetical protein